MRTIVAFALVAGAAAVLAQTSVQGSGEDLHGLKVTALHPKPTPTPFPLAAAPEGKQTRATLEFRAPEQMSERDRELAAENESEIVRRAGLQGFQPGVGRASKSGEEIAGGGAWGYEQAVCPVFPDHLVLEYSRSNGAGDVTLFSAVIPRGDGHVRVIPVQRRGYSLWTPASSNALTLNDFNHMVKEEPGGLSADWLTLGLCYAALTGGHVRAGLIAATAAEEKYPLANPATLRVSAKGGAEVHFTDAGGSKAAMEWTMTFAQSGRLLKVRRKTALRLVEKPVVGNAEEVKGVPMKESAVDLSKPGN